MSDIPMVEASERGRISFTIHSDDDADMIGGGARIAITNANGSDFRTLTTDAQPITLFAWSPDGTRIAYTVQVYTNLPDFMSGGSPTDSLSSMQSFYGNMGENFDQMMQM